MGLEYRVPVALQQKALRDLHRSFYIFATVIVFFAVLGFLFIVWYYGALSFPSNSNKDSTSSMNGLNITNSSRSESLRASPVQFDSLATCYSEVVSTFLKQEGGMSAVFESTHVAVWLFNSVFINTSSPAAGDFSTVTKHNLIVLADASGSTVRTSYHTDLLNDDIRVTSMVGIGTNIYLFYSKLHNNAYGIGKLYYSNNTLTFSIVHNDFVLPGPIVMATSTKADVHVYCQLDSHLELLSLPRYAFEVMIYNGQLWASFKLTNNNPNTLALLNITNPANHARQVKLDGDGDGDGSVLYSVEWNEYWAQYVMLSTKDSKVSVWHSTSPEGPFKLQTSFSQTISSDITHTYFHKEMWRGEGRIMVFTYCTNGNSGSLPHLAEIECTIENSPV